MLKPPPQIRTKEDFKRCMAEGIELSVVAAKGVQPEPLAIGRVTSVDEQGMTVHIDGSPFDMMEHFFYETDPGKVDM